MRYFNNRSDPKYKDAIEDVLNIEYLASSAEKLREVKSVANKTYTHHCRVNFNGISATKLLDKGKNHSEQNVYNSFSRLFEEIEALNEKKAYLTIRILLIYPYSLYSSAIINAETTSNRSSIREHEYKPDYLLLEDIDERSFHGSTIVKSQVVCLDNLQKLVERHGWNQPTSPNKAVIRFSLFSPSIMSLIVNDVAFYEAYHLARPSRDKFRFAMNMPVMELRKTGKRINEKADPEWKAFCCVADHFRYLWRHNSTLDCEDATEYDRNFKKPKSLSALRKPAEINYHRKLDRIRSRIQDSIDSESPRGTKKDNLHQKLANWRIMAKNQLMLLSSEPILIPRAESLFISCSWRKREDGNAEPNSDAANLDRWLRVDFCEPLENPLMDVHILRSVLADPFTPSLYQHLSRSTLAIVLITKDIRAEGDVFYAKPNIYHEIGYLMKQFSQISPQRFMIIREKGVEIPSNIRDITRIEYETGEFSFRYIDILEWLSQYGPFFDSSHVAIAAENHITRIEELSKTKVIKKKQANSARDRLQKFLDSLEM